MPLKKKTAGRAQLIEQIKALEAQLNLSKEERMERAFSMKPLDKGIWTLLHDNGFKTGSTVYAQCVDAADEDWCIHISPDAFAGYAYGIDDAEYFETDGFASLYAHDGQGKIINIICFSDYNLFEAWHHTTQIMEQMMRITTRDFTFDAKREEPSRCHLDIAFNTKWKRVRIFGALRDILWPVKNAINPPTREDARKYHKCIECGRKADFFTCKARKDEYRDTLICERCQDIHKNGAVEDIDW